MSGLYCIFSSFHPINIFPSNNLNKKITNNKLREHVDVFLCIPRMVVTSCHYSYAAKTKTHTLYNVFLSHIKK